MNMIAKAPRFNVAASYLIMPLALLLGSATAAQAQFAGNSGEDTTIDADTITNASGVTILTGQVDVRQGKTRILADTMKIYSGGAGVANATNDISKIEANGNFYYITPEQEVRGTNGVYTQIDDTFIVTGDVILLQGENIVTGDRLIYDVTTERARVSSNCKGRKCGSQGRVSILIKNGGKSQNQ